TFQNNKVYVMLNFSADRLSHTCTPAGQWNVLLGTYRSGGTAIGSESFEVYPYEVLILEKSK
ncbi:MAG: hypothetical protein PHU70_09700, partial [Dehalococcoidia bacterium]|nr:hypothetical protein [Dehalococcoidia bacterium]